MKAFLLVTWLSLVVAAPFAGEPSIWTVKVTSGGNCTKGKGPTSPSNSSVLEGATGIYGCYKGDKLGQDYYVTCNATHIFSHVFEASKADEPCRGTLVASPIMPLGSCVDTDWTGAVTGLMYTYNCFGMWCNSTCDEPPCPTDFPCPEETACCLNDNRFEVQCGTTAGCSGDAFRESWFWWLLRHLALLGIVGSAIFYAWKMGWCNICPWRRPYSTLYGEMA